MIRKNIQDTNFLRNPTHQKLEKNFKIFKY